MFSIYTDRYIDDCMREREGGREEKEEKQGGERESGDNIFF